MLGTARAQLWTHPLAVTALYLVATLILTWPLAIVMTSQIAGDNGDTLFNSWVLLWTSGQVLAALHGNFSALAQYWNANIFYPASLTLAYSEHLTPQMLQILPVLAVTGNIVLAYNVLFLGTIVLSGLGVYLLVRELTDQPVAAFLAGLAFAFAPYRIDQFAHIEVLSSQWMPFALYGFRRFFVSGRIRPLVGGAAALLTQALSCGYYMAYFTPFALAYCLFEMASRGRLADLPTWRALVAAGGAVLVVVGLFLWPYFQVRHTGELGVRGLSEIQSFSADTHAFATVSENSRLWGSRIQAMQRSEGQGFPGFATLAFAALGVAFGVRRALNHERRDGEPTARWRRWLMLALWATALLFLALLGHALVTGRASYTVAGMRLRYSPGRLLLQMACVAGALFLASPAFRRLIRGVPDSTVAYFAWGAVAAAWLSLGPTMYANDRPLGPGLYDIFYRWVPGFDGLRVPSLNFMLVAFLLSVLAGLGAAPLVSRGRGAGRLLVVAGMIAILAESWSTETGTTVPLPAPIYTVVAGLPEGTALAEFPFGDLETEIRYTFDAGFHRKPIINGYSGFFPSRYVVLQGRLSHLPLGPEAWQALLTSGATHAVVHEAAYPNQTGPSVSEWLRRSGASETATFQTDHVFQLR